MATPDYLSLAEAKESLKSVLNVYNDDAGAYDADRLTADINGCESEVNAAIRGRYTVPATSSVSILFLSQLTLSLLRNRAYSRLASVETPIVVLSEAKAARQQLRDISAGKLQLPDESQNTTTGVGQYFNYSSNTPRMTRSKLEGF